MAPKENQKGRRCPEGMKAPVGLLSRRPVCEANAACSARQGHGDFDALQPGGVCSLLAPKENQKGRRCPEGMKAPVGLLSRRPVCEANAACSARQGHGDFDALQPGGVCSLLAPKENQKGRRCPEGMKAPVGLLSRRPVCEANAACLARQGHGDFDALQPGGDCSLLPHKREPERTAVPGGHESPSGAFKPQTGLRSKCRVFSAARARRFRCAAAGRGLFSFGTKREPEKCQRFRRAGPTNQGLLALDNPKAEVEAEKC